LRLRLFSFGGYGLALAAFALMVFGAIDNAPPPGEQYEFNKIVSYIGRINCDKTVFSETGAV